MEAPEGASTGTNHRVSKNDGCITLIWGCKIAGSRHGAKKKASEGHTATDEFELFLMWPHGQASEMHFNINVW